MSRSEILVALDNHLSNGGKMQDFKANYSSDNPSLGEVNTAFVIHLAQRLYVNFPGKVNMEGSEFIKRRAKELGLTTEILKPINDSASALLDFSSAGYVDIGFDNEKVPSREGFFVPSWSLHVNLNKDKKKLGSISFEEGFFTTVAENESEGLRMLASVYGAGAFLDLLDKRLGDIAHFVDVPDEKLVPLVIECSQKALEETASFYGLMKVFGNKF